MIKFYNGNYTLNIGHPMVILTINEDDKNFIAEEFIFFESSKEMTFLAYKTINRKFQNLQIEDFIEIELTIIKSIIYNDIIVNKLFDEKTDIIPEIKINLKESTQSLLSFLKFKSKENLKKVLEKTDNDELKELIKLNLSIVVKREKL